MRYRLRLLKAFLGLSLLVSVSQLASCRCQQEGNASDLPAAVWSAQNPIQLADESLPDARYVALGLATHDHNWSSEDMKQAAAYLQALATTKPGRLPRYRSTHSGEVFARITSRDNLAVLHNPAASVSIRLPAALVFAHELNEIYTLYVAALRAKTVTGEDVTELHAARLRACQTILDLAEEFVPTLSKADPKYQTRLDGIEAMRGAAADAMLAALHALKEPLFFGLSARQRLVATCRETFPTIAARLPIMRRDVLLQELRASAAHPNLSNLQPELGKLLDEVTRRVAAVPERDAS